MAGIFDDALFDDPYAAEDEALYPFGRHAPHRAAHNEGVIPGWSVRARGSGEVLGDGLTHGTAVRLAIQHSAEIWGYGRTTRDSWPNVEPFKADLLAYGEGGQLVKTAEWPL